MPLFNAGIPTPVVIANGGTGSTTAVSAYAALNTLPEYGWFRNLAIASATTTNANDSVKITSADGSALSAANPGYVRLGGTTAGQLVEFTVTADVTIKTTGAHWGIDPTGDIIGALLSVLAINDNGTLRWGIAYVGGRHTLLTTDTTATQTSVTLPEHVLTTAAVGSASNTCRELGFVRSDFDNTGGAAEKLWTNQTGVGDIVTGQTADGLWQPWNTVSGGFSVNPTYGLSRWCRNGRMIILVTSTRVDGTSNSVSYTQTAPVKGTGIDQDVGQCVNITDNGAAKNTTGWVRVPANSATLALYSDSSGNAWTNTNAKGATFFATYAVGPSASFID